MQDQDKTKEQLIDELNEMRRKVAEFHTGTLLNTLLEAIPLPIFYKDTNGRFMGFNKSFEEFFGKTSRELIGKGVFDIYPRDLAEVYHKKDIELFHNPGVQVYDTQLKDASGNIHDIFFHKSTYSDTQGHVLGLIGVILDISDRKRAEEALSESEKRYRLIAETIRDCFWMATPNIDKMLYVSPAYETIWGRSCESLYESPRSFVDAIHPGDRNRVLDVLEKHRSKVTSWNVDYRIVWPDGSIHWVEDRGFPVRDENGEWYLNIGVATDVTERKRLEEDKESVIVELQKALSEVKKLSGFLPICSSCKKIRDDKGYWSEIERYIGERTDTQFSHGICPDCMRKLYPDYADEVLEYQKNKDK